MPNLISQLMFITLQVTGPNSVSVDSWWNTKEECESQVTALEVVYPKVEFFCSRATITIHELKGSLEKGIA